MKYTIAHIKTILGLTFLFLSINQFIYSQYKGKIFSSYFSNKDYNAGSQNWDLVQSPDGIIYVGNQAGMLKYDGTSWEKYKIPGRGTVRTLEIANDGKIIIGAINELGFFSLDQKGKLEYHSLRPLIDSAYQDFGDVWNVEIINNQFYFLTDKYLFRYNGKDFKVWENFGDYFYYSYKIDNQLIVQVLGKGLYVVKGDSLEQLPGSEFFSTKKILTILPFKGKMLIGTRSFGLYIYDGFNRKYSIRSISDVSNQAKTLNEFYIKNEIYSGLMIDNERFAIGTINGEALIFDSQFKLWDVINKSTTGYSNGIYFMHYAADGNLWAAMDNGILKVELAVPFRYWNSEAGLNGNVISIASFNQSIYVSTTMGVYFMESENNSKDIIINRFIENQGIRQQSWTLLELSQKSLDRYKHKKYLLNKSLGKHKILKRELLVASNTGIYAIDKSKAKKLFDYQNIYTLYPSPLDSSIIYVGLRDGLARINYIDGEWYDNGRIPFIQEQTSSFAQDKYGNLWISNGNGNILKLPGDYTDYSKYPSLNNVPNILQIFDTINGLPEKQALDLYQINRDVKFYSDSNDYIYNYSSGKFERDLSIGENFIDSTWKNAIYIDGKERFWIDASEKNKKNGKYYADSLTFKRIKDFLISNIIRDSLDYLWIGSPDGLFCYNQTYQKNYHIPYPAIIRKVSVNDSIIYHGINYKNKTTGSVENIEFDFSNKVNFKPLIPYYSNSISFTYAATTYEAEFKPEFSYFLQGYDKSWSAWSNETKKGYTNLPEGKYIFKVKARNFYGIESTHASFEFEILTPWFRSIPAIIGYIVLIIGLIVLIVKGYTYKLLLEKQKLENLVLARTQEILMQNEEIMVQAENLKEANEKIQAKNEELEIQKSELEMSNATKNKFFRIIAHDLRNPISTFVNSTAYILDDYQQHGIEKTRLFLTELNKLSQTTYNLLENLLEWSTNQMGQIRFEPKMFNISKLVKENIELIEHRIELKMIKLTNHLNENLQVYADENMIDTVIRNLLSNAIKFTPENGTIDINCNLQGEDCEIRIADSGIGISQEDMDKLFRIDLNFSTPGTQNEKGSGLGLILCKDFIEKNGGILNVSSVPGKGSTFSFILKSKQSHQ